jgi:4-hydroxy-3-methylbut-2-en-1-yl diphosphate synthase IspG/GcpE
MRRPKPQRELIACHDCGAGVSFSAASCPHCGSQEPSGPHVLSSQEIRRHRIEQRNDRTLALAVVGCAASGAFYGIVMSASQIGAVVAGCGYAFVGMIIGACVGFVINMTRNL